MFQLHENQNLLEFLCACSEGKTQQCPTELTGRCYDHWLSIHRSSPRAPSLVKLPPHEIKANTFTVRFRKKEIKEQKTASRCRASCCVRRLSAGNSDSTGTDATSTWSCCYTQRAPEILSLTTNGSVSSCSLRPPRSHSPFSCRPIRCGNVPETKKRGRKKEEEKRRGQPLGFGHGGSCFSTWGVSAGEWLWPPAISSTQFYCPEESASLLTLVSNWPAKGPRPV